ncbi:MAG: polyprenyl synthetase family protein [Proteobacteria bacterium]|nr:polyprenyl synthetase family protein [Pseudomonadota bacterium]
MTISPFEELKKYHQPELERVYVHLFKMVENHVTIIQDLGEHVFGTEGKRLRPLLVLACSKLFKDNIPEESIFLSAAVECIHTATLVHDDVLDNSDLRRGHPTAKALWGNSCSILVGDYLFSKAFEYMVACHNMDVLSMLSKASSKICEGEVKQMQITKEMILNKYDYFNVIDLKTASLFESACKAGSMIVNANQTYVNALGQFGLNLGRAFQIIDDILDYKGSKDSTGKKPGNDYMEGKITLPIIELIERDWLFKEIFQDEKKAEFKTIQEAMEQYNIFDICYAKAQEYTQQALLALDIISDHPVLDILKKLPLYLQNRMF